MLGGLLWCNNFRLDYNTDGYACIFPSIKFENAVLLLHYLHTGVLLLY